MIKSNPLSPSDWSTRATYHAFIAQFTPAAVHKASCEILKVLKQGRDLGEAQRLASFRIAALIRYELAALLPRIPAESFAMHATETALDNVDYNELAEHYTALASDNMRPRYESLRVYEYTACDFLNSQEGWIFNRARRAGLHKAKSAAQKNQIAKSLDGNYHLAEDSKGVRIYTPQGPFSTADAARVAGLEKLFNE